MKVIITGSTGMVGKAVLLECLNHKSVTEILVINRHSIGITHAKLTELLHHNFNDFSPIKKRLEGYDACFYCMGISSVGRKEEEFNNITYRTTKALANLLYEINPQMVFNYVSGTGTDSSEKGQVMWARIKGKTENMILNMGFKDAYAFRPGIILPEKGVKSKTGWYNLLYIITTPLFPLLKKLDSVTLSSSVGIAMINTLLYPQSKKHLENKDINTLALKAE